MTSAAFVVAIALLVQRGSPRFAQLSSTMFGLFYCGYLPCFWVKLRCGLAAPALNTGKWQALAFSPFIISQMFQFIEAKLSAFSSLICPFDQFSLFLFYRCRKDMANSSWWSSSLDSWTCGDIDFFQRCYCNRHICFSRWQGNTNDEPQG